MKFCQLPFTLPSIQLHTLPHPVVSAFRTICLDQNPVSILRFGHSALILSFEFTLPFCFLRILPPFTSQNRLLWFKVWWRLWKGFFCCHRCNRQSAAENTNSHKQLRLWHDSDLSICHLVKHCGHVLKLHQPWWTRFSSADDDRINVEKEQQRMILTSLKVLKLCYHRWCATGHWAVLAWWIKTLTFWISSFNYSLPWMSVVSVVPLTVHEVITFLQQQQHFDWYPLCTMLS